MQEGTQKDIRTVISSFNRDELEASVAQRAESLGMSYFDIRNVEISPDLLSLVSKEEAARGVLPISRKNKEFMLGVADPNSEESKNQIKYFSKFYKVTPALISWEAIKDFMPRYVGISKQTLEKSADYEISASDKAMTFQELESQINSAPIQNILSFVVSSAIGAGASDIHIEPQKEGARLRFRIDGVLHIVGYLDKERNDYILSQIELSGGMKLNSDEAQEGRIEVKFPEENISIRVETMPTLYGDDVSLRIFNTKATMLQLSDLGLYKYDMEILEKSLARPQGMILMVGPTGSGKTSSIYALLNILNKPEVKIITLEDPIEYALSGITQSQIHEGENFNTRLKAVLREDPDIVMVGEIRDAETANVALHAALTGHVMISTFHAYNAATAISLLKEISQEASLLASAINLLVAQRLVRRLCDCKEKYVPDQKEQEFVDKTYSEIPEIWKENRVLKFYRPKGCDKCGKIGYKGRVGIFELLPMNVDLQKLISRADITASEIQEAAQKSGMITMEQDGLLKAIDGITSLSEIMKAIKE